MSEPVVELEEKVVHFGSIVPGAVTVYAMLSLLDFGFSLIAFQLGYAEANPFLDFMKENGLFEAVKLGTTLLIVLIGVLLWKLKSVRLIVHTAIVFMFALFFFHLYGLLRHLVT